MEKEVGGVDGAAFLEGGGSGAYGKYLGNKISWVVGRGDETTG